MRCICARTGSGKGGCASRAQVSSLSVRAYDQGGRVYFETALPSLPADLPQTFEEGFARMETSEGPWRVFTHVTDEGNVQIGQPVATRDALAESFP